MNVLKTKSSKLVRIGDVKIPDNFFNRYKTGDDGIDSIFGEGILPGSTLTLTGQAGAGKTSFMLQMLEQFEEQGITTAYASGEEDIAQLAYSAKRLGVQNLRVVNMTDVDELTNLTKEADVLIIDSMQSLSVSSSMNSREKEAYIVTTLLGAAKENSCSIIFIAHRTKSGSMKGSTLIPHSVDVNIEILHNKELGDGALIINTYKNRFGATNEYDAEMTSTGIIFHGTITQPARKSKNSKSDTLKSELLELKGITKQKVIEELGVSGTKAYVLLKELTDAGLLKKEGRGQGAVWNLVK